MARTRSPKKARGFLVQKPLGQFTERVQAVGPEHFGVVCVDCAKASSKFCLCDFYGNVLIEPTTVEHTQPTLRAAIDRVRAVMAARGVSDGVVAIERTGTYHRPVQDAFRRAAFDTRLVRAFDTRTASWGRICSSGKARTAPAATARPAGRAAATRRRATASTCSSGTRRRSRDTRHRLSVVARWTSWTGRTTPRSPCGGTSPNQCPRRYARCLACRLNLEVKDVKLSNKAAAIPVS